MKLLRFDLSSATNINRVIKIQSFFVAKDNPNPNPSPNPNPNSKRVFSCVDWPICLYFPKSSLHERFQFTDSLLNWAVSVREMLCAAITKRLFYRFLSNLVHIYNYSGDRGLSKMETVSQKSTFTD